MFKNNLVLSVKADNKFFRENDGSISVPFGLEYSIYIKNLDSRRAVINRLLIDGEDVISGNKLVIESNSILELEGFMDGNQALNKFKFIERTNLIEDHRGIKPDDGLIVLEFDYEKKLAQTVSVTYIPTWIYIPEPYLPNSPYEITWSDTTTYANNITYTSHKSGGKGSSASMPLTNSFNIANNVGITVKGNDIEQNFHGTYVGAMENDPTVVSIKLVGFNKNRESKPVFVHDKIKCETCGLESKSNNKFCGRCGTRLMEGQFEK